MTPLARSSRRTDARVPSERAIAVQDHLGRLGGLEHVGGVAGRAEVAGEAPAGGREVERVGRQVERGHVHARERRGPARLEHVGDERRTSAPPMIVARGPRRARSAFSSLSPPSNGSPPMQDAVGAGRARPCPRARGSSRPSGRTSPSRRSGRPAGGRAAERVGPRRRPPEAGAVVEHVDAAQSQLPREHRHAPRPAGPRARRSAEVVAHAGRVVDVRLAAEAARRGREPPAARQAGWVFDGLMIASGPPGARLRIGISTSAQCELYGPITATSRSARAYALALAAHLRGS